MVSVDARIGLNLEELPLIKRGAESEIRRGRFLGVDAVYKIRVRKPYMHPRLAESLARARTKREAKIIAAARRGGVSAPALLAVFPSLAVLIMEYVEGRLLKDELDRLGGGLRPVINKAGETLGRLHRLGIVHGDPTTSNYILSRGVPVLIDYGLSEFSESIEDRAVDLHLFRRAASSTHASIADSLYKWYVEGYLSEMGLEGERVVNRAEEVRLRGRYVRERKKTVWG